MDDPSYQACIRSLWNIAEHLNLIDMAELRRCAEQHGTADDISLIDQLNKTRRLLPPHHHRRQLPE